MNKCEMEGGREGGEEEDVGEEVTGLRTPLQGRW